MLQTRKSKKDGRKRTYSLVSNTTNPQAGPVASPKTVENSSPSQRPNGSRQALNAPVAPANPKKPESKKMPNVFEFLEENDESSSDSSSLSSSSESESDEEPEPPRPIQSTTQIQAPKPRTNTVPHGVLVSGGNISPKKVTQSPPVASKSPKEPRKPAPSTGNQLVTRKRQPTRKPSPISTAQTSPGIGELELSRPQTYHGSPRDNGAIHRPPLPPSPPRSPEDSLHRTTPTKRRDSNVSQEPSGYGLLASHLTKSASEESGSFPPLYRRFETVNHRVLLHLQDEISQMEEDLHTLDEYEEIHRVSTAEQEGAKPFPASRRRDAQAQAYSSLHYRRMDLMSTLIQKTEQYNNALCAYSKVLQTLPRASEQDIADYRGWMREHKPIAGVETRFLIHDADLVSLTPRLAASAAAAPVYVAIIIASGALLLPLLAFSLIAEFSGRLVVVTVVGGAAAAIAANYSAGIDTLVDSRDGWRCATIYFGFMAIAAMFIP
ncbi:hypothetical protein DTO013E5_1307 [Penicillium roqueforti]|uniref:Genomic scaffold, ProqFM164S01 n=1 Tax=Penicillium roqueforti (strain FM164) TaxID=1365484 RepID=W6Q421_PENRF|nr:hypothetical protein DTO012A1_64 [Penicillium roqueforti]CDM28879.1 unnamed protein product [Penicillium roqueforti FM164]KAI2750999.1 hypothetical protein DTO013F2_4250 [Penicillium roqueforti]KAI2775061.1 hypothetical protein DTO012A8_546 [Penicillium roqueforti]KAI3083693.1 hypothetical protein CBS147339_2069 [Penicillium roqueforti]